MKINKTKYNKLNNMLCSKLYYLNCVNNLKYLKTNNNKDYITYTINSEYIKIFNKSSKYLKVNYKELIKLKKTLKSGYLVLSTSLGILTDKKAITHKIGGTILGYIKNNEQ